MQKLIDEFDHLIEPGTIVTEIILSGATYDDWGYTLQENDKADLFSVIIRVEYGFYETLAISPTVRTLLLMPRGWLRSIRHR
ncbi:hypothetical protein SODG_004724 [Sodalis praecaptivus]